MTIDLAILRQIAERNQDKDFGLLLDIIDIQHKALAEIVHNSTRLIAHRFNPAGIANRALAEVEVKLQ